MDNRLHVFMSDPEMLRAVLERIDRVLAIQPMTVDAMLPEWDQGYVHGKNWMRAAIQDMLRGLYNDESEAQNEA